MASSFEAWDNFIRGRIAKTWHLVQLEYPHSKNITNWPKHLIRILHKVSDTIWTVRNTLKFGESSPTLTHGQLRLKPRITQHYMTYLTTTHKDHHHLFQVPLPTRLMFSATENIQWLKTVKAAQKIQKKLQKQFLITQPKI